MSDAKLEHTPLPWHLDNPDDPDYIFDEKMRMVAQMRGIGAQLPIKANAELIIAAVNSYTQREAMRSALEKLLSLCELAMSAPRYRSDEQKAALAEGYAALEVK